MGKMIDLKIRPISERKIRFTSADRERKYGEVREKIKSLDYKQMIVIDTVKEINAEIHRYRAFAATLYTDQYFIRVSKQSETSFAIFKVKK